MDGLIQKSYLKSGRVQPHVETKPQVDGLIQKGYLKTIKSIKWTGSTMRWNETISPQVDRFIKTIVRKVDRLNHSSS